MVVVRFVLVVVLHGQNLRPGHSERRGAAIQNQCGDGCKYARVLMGSVVVFTRGLDSDP